MHWNEVDDFSYNIKIRAGTLRRLLFYKLLRDPLKCVSRFFQCFWSCENILNLQLEIRLDHILQRVDLRDRCNG